MRAFLPLALLTVTACYSPRAVDQRPGPYEAPPGAWEANGPLEASVWYDEYTGVANFEISRPANVAMFALRPGAGLEMIYPAIGYGNRMTFTSGSHFVRTAGSPYRLTGNWSMMHGQGPMYILLVASERPLDVDPFRATGTLAWLNRSSITYNPYVTLEALVGEIVPSPSTGEWTTAMHVVWPMAVGPYRDTRARYMKVQCPSGMIVVVPFEAWVRGYPVCPSHVAPGDSTAADSTGKVLDGVPDRPRPPQGWMTASVDGTDLWKELDRVRDENGKGDLGRLALTPFDPRIPGLERDGADRATHRGFDRARGATPRHATRPGADRASREARPAAERVARPEARPRPATRPRPTRPATPPKPKPKKPTGGGGGGS